MPFRPTEMQQVIVTEPGPYLSLTGTAISVRDRQANIKFSPRLYVWIDFGFLESAPVE